MIKKWFVAILFLLAGFIGHSQTKPVGLPVPYAPTGFYRVAWVKSDSGLIGPMKDTTYLPRFTGTITFRPQDRQPYYYDSTTLLWNKFLLGPDTSSLSTRINSKLFLSDTASMLDPYLHYNDTTNRWTQDIYSRNDSLFKVKNGVELFIDTIGGGGGGGDGTVTSVGMTVPSAFNVSTSSITTSGTFNISGAGTTGQYIRGNGTLATTDTSMITNFYIKSRGLLSGSSPITYNNFTGAFGINNANTSGTKGAASFVNGSFSDNGSGLIDLATVTTAGSCTNCNVTYDAKGRATSYANGTGGSGSNTRRSVIKATLDSIQLVNDVSESPELGKVFKYAIDSTGENRGYVEEQYYVSKQVSEFRSLRTADTSLIYRTIINGVVSDFYWDTLSTDADDSVMCIKINSITTGRLKRYITWFVSPDWFGAKSNDGQDDSYAIQKAMDYAVASPKAPTVLFYGGTYHANNINIINKPSAEYSFVTLKVQGTSFLVGEATVIQTNNANGFAFHIMIARQVEIDNITFIGQGLNPTAAQVITWSNAQWATGVRDNINSPHAAIVIDGYHSSVTSGNQYPGMSAYYTNSQTGGSSQITIRNCSFKRFVTAIIEGAAGSVANGDNIKALDCYFEANRTAWACGQTQSRANSIENCYFLFHQYIINGVEYGAQQGTPPNALRCNIAGATKYLYHINGTFSGLTFQECYSESLFSLGRCSAPVQFTDCELMLNTDPFAFQAPRIAEGDQVSFKGGRFGYFDNISKMSVAFAVKNLSFDGVSLLCLPLNLNSSVFDAFLGKTVFDNCRFIGSGQTGDTWEANVVNTGNFQTSLSNSVVMMPGSKYVLTDVNKRVSVESISPKIEYYNFDDTSINIDTATATAYFISDASDAYQIYDVLAEQDNITWSGDNSMYTTGPTIFGQVYAISGDTVRIRYVPYGLEEGVNYPIYIVRIPHLVPRFFGDITSGSNSITNVDFAAFQPLVGDWIKGAGIPDATRITNISGTTVTISRDALSNSTGVEFYDAKIYTEVRTRDASLALSQLGFTKGDVVINTRELSLNDTIAYWICKTPGFDSGTPAVEWEYVKAGPSGGGGTPGGVDEDVQINSSGSFAGYAGFKWNNTNRRATIRSATAPDLNTLNDHNLKILGNRVYIGDTTSNEPTFFEFGDPYGLANSTAMRMTLGWMGSEEFNIGVNFHYRGQTHLKYDYSKMAQWLAFDTHYFLMQAQGIGYAWNDNAGSKVAWRFDNIEAAGQVKGAILSTNGFNLVDYTTSTYQNNDGTMAQFRVSSATLGIGGLQAIRVPDTTQFFLGSISDPGPLLGIQKVGASTGMLMRNDENSTNTNYIQFLKRRGSSYGITQGDRIGYLDYNTLNEFGVKANATTILSGAFRLGDFYWNTTGADGNTDERMRLTSEGSLGIGTNAPSTKLHLVGSARFDLGSDGNYDIYYRNSSGAFTRLAAGTNGYVLTTHSTSSAPTWEAPASGGITSINSQTGSSQSIVSGSSFLTVNSATNTHTISVDPDYLSSGTYTPTLTNVSNIGASTAFVCQYTVVGDMVTVSGEVDIDPSATGTIQLGISLPVSTAFAGSNELGGTSVAGAVEGLNASIRADATNERAELIGTLPVASSISNNKWHFIFMYKITGT